MAPDLSRGDDSEAGDTVGPLLSSVRKLDDLGRPSAVVFVIRVIAGRSGSQANSMLIVCVPSSCHRKPSQVPLKSRIENLVESLMSYWPLSH